MDVCRESTLQLLNFVDVIAIGSGSPERLLTVLEVFDTMRDLIIPELKSLFRDQYSGSLQSEATTVWKRLGEAIRGIFTELGNLILGNSTEIVDPFRVHPITSYVMNYLCAASASRKTLEQVFEGDYGDPLKEFPEIEDRVHSSSDLSVQMGFIMGLLENKLIDESKKLKRKRKKDGTLNKEADLSLLFLIRNCDYVVQKAKESELGAILGDDWFKKHRNQLQIIKGSKLTHLMTSCEDYIAALNAVTAMKALTELCLAT
jgi:hypothetical protein